MYIEYIIYTYCIIYIYMHVSHWCARMSVQSAVISLRTPIHIQFIYVGLYILTSDRLHNTPEAGHVWRAQGALRTMCHQTWVDACSKQNRTFNTMFDSTYTHTSHTSIFVCLFVCLFVYLYVYLSIYRSMYLSMDLSMDLSMGLSIYLPIYLSTYLSIYLSIYLSVYLSIYLLSIYLSNYATM